MKMEVSGDMGGEADDEEGDSGGDRVEVGVEEEELWQEL